MANKWTAAQIPDQHGRVAVVTGANSGIGFFAARELARAGARVVLAVRDAEKGATAAREITAAVPNAELEVGSLDLSSLDSVRGFAQYGTKLGTAPSSVKVIDPDWAKPLTRKEMKELLETGSY